MFGKKALWYPLEVTEDDIERLSWLIHGLRDYALHTLFGFFIAFFAAVIKIRKGILMDKEIQVAKEVKIEVKVAAGKVQLLIEVDSDMLLDELAAKIPGQIDDAVIQVIKAALKIV